MRLAAWAAVAFTCNALSPDVATPATACNRKLGALSRGATTAAEAFAACCSAYSSGVCTDVASYLEFRPKPWAAAVFDKVCLQLEASATSDRDRLPSKLLLRRERQRPLPVSMLDYAAHDKVHHGRKLAPAYNWRSARKDYEAQQKEFYAQYPNYTSRVAHARDSGAVLKWAEQMQQNGTGDLAAALGELMPSAAAPAAASSHSPQSSDNTTYGYRYVPRNNALPVEYYTATDDTYPHGEIEAFGA